MTDIRALRLGRGLTFIDLALLTEIPARTLAELEYGLQVLDQEQRVRLACVFGVAPQILCTTARHRPPIDHRSSWIKRGVLALVAAIIGTLCVAVPMLNQQPASAAPQRAAPTTTSGAATARAGSIARPHPTTTPMATPTRLPTPTPRFVLAADGPHGCPLAPAAGHVVVTQGYDEGTHMPANVWGAVDLAIDGDGDGNADPDATQGAPIAATTGGVARVYMGSWPGGNYVRVVGQQAGWSSAYAHLDSVAVADGQTIDVGATIGTVGSTGMTSGPHLHYEVWHAGENIDPTGLIECR